MMIEQSDSNNSSGEGPVQLLGEFLKERRLAKNFTLEKISQKTKINLSILRAIEANDYNGLPSPAYIKGFVTSYSKTLGLDRDEVHSKMEYTYYQVVGKAFPALNHTHNFKAQENTKSATPVEVEQAPHKVIENSKNVLESSKSLLPLAIFGIVVIAIVGGYQIVSSVIKDEVDASKQQDLGPTFESSAALLNEKPATPKVETTEETEVKEEEVTAAAESVKVEEKKEEPVVAKVEEKKEELVEKIVPEKVRNFPSVDFRKVRNKLYTLLPDAPENDNEELLPADIKSKMNSSIQNVYIRATDGNTWLSYKVDERPIESAIIEKGKDLFLQGTQLRIFLGNVRVTKIFYNNKLIGADSKSGVKSLIFPESNNSQYYLPLFPKAKDDILYTGEEYMKRMKLEEDQLKEEEN